MEDNCKFYFKCYLCKIFNKRDFKKCNIMSLKKGNLCYYNTGWSIWKWFIRFIIVLTCSIVPLWYVRYGIWDIYYIRSEKDPPLSLQLLLGIFAIIVTIFILLFFIVVIYTSVSAILNNFKRRSGTYFGKDKRY